MTQAPEPLPLRPPSVPRLLRALRAARGVSQDGWAALLGVSRPTVSRWENGMAVPGAEVEQALLDVCQERSLFRTYGDGPLAGVSLTPALLRALLAAARLGAGARDAARSTPPAGVRPRGGTSAAAPTARRETVVSFPHQAPTNRQPFGPAGVSVNLPVPLTDLVGRDEAVAECARRLTDARLLTLSGPGGIGKSRLALEVATRLSDEFPDGVCLVELATIVEPALVPQAIATALGVAEASPAPLLDTLAAALRTRRLLLILDNCEHLVEPSARTAQQLLTTCPTLHILATSREPLGVAGEHIWRVPPLPIPSLGGEQPASVGGSVRPAVERLDDVASVRLFTERAQAVAPDFRLTAANAGAVARICARLDGIPLALELAAARVRVLTVEQIMERLDDCLPLLSQGGRTAPARQQTLEAALDWSYDLLSAPEQILLRRLAVFAGGFTLEAAEAVANAQSREPAHPIPHSAFRIPHSAFRIPHSDVLDLLTRLIDKSLIMTERADAAARYRLLEPVRHYAWKHLAAAGEDATLRAGHAAYYRALAEQAEPHLHGPAQPAWFQRLTRERDNLRAALRWSIDAGDRAGGLRLAGALVRFWEAQGYLSEGRRWLGLLLSGPDDGSVPAEVRARALLGAGCLARWQLDLDESVSSLTAALAIFRGLGHTWGVAETLNWLAVAHRRRGEADHATRLFEESLALYRDIAHEPGVAEVLLNLCLDAYYRGDAPRAAALGAQGLAIAERLGDLRTIVRARTQVGFAELRRGSVDEAADHFAAGMAAHRQAGYRWFAGHALVGLAGVLAARSRPRAAARLLGAVAALRAALPTPVPPDAYAEQPIEAAVRSQLPAADIAIARDEGAALTLEQAVAEAIRETAATG